MGKYYSSTIQKGSKGDDVKQWQTFLNSNGYNLSVDGDFGDNTLAATTDWQTKNGLGADGIVGEKTWGKAGYTNYSTISTPTSAPNINTTPTATPTIDPLPTNPTYDSTSWDDTEKGQSAGKAYQDAQDALNNHGPFEFSQNDWLELVKQHIKDYGDFSYDVNGDALYQQLKDQYIQQGKLAMQDTMGQASAMTGGYGNSYAQSAGQQAYQGQLDNLNDMVPQLYQMALDRYTMGKEDLYNQYGLLMQEYEKEYGLHSDEYQKLMDALGIARSDYYDGGNMHYTEQSNKNSVLGQEFSDAMSLWTADTDQKWEEWKAAESIRQDTNDELWQLWTADETTRQAALDEYWRNREWDYTTSNGSGSGSSGSSGSGSSGGSSVSGGNDGTVGSGSASAIPDNVVKKAASFESNQSLANYIDGLVASGTITEAQGDQLYAQNVDDNEKTNDKGAISYQNMANSTSGWSVVDDGGWNLWGVDDNAIVKAPNGEQIRLDDLVDKLVSEGMKKSDAKALVKKLQKNLGI